MKPAAAMRRSEVLSTWEDSVEDARARLNENADFIVKPKRDTAARACCKSICPGNHRQWPSAPPREPLEQLIDYPRFTSRGGLKSKQGAGALAEARDRYPPRVAEPPESQWKIQCGQRRNSSTSLAGLLTEQARWAETEKLQRTSSRSNQTRSAIRRRQRLRPPSVPRTCFASSLFPRNAFREANASYASIDVREKNWDDKRRERLIANGWSRIFTPRCHRDVEKVVLSPEKSWRSRKERVGDKHYDHRACSKASSRPVLSYARKGTRRRAEQFKAAIPTNAETQRGKRR